MSNNQIQFDALRKFSHQITFALSNYSNHGLNFGDYTNVIIGGLGGSGIGARITKTWFVDSFPLPVDIVSNYHLPAYADTKSVVILCSYSGNTEETLSIYEEARTAGCKMIVITTGGKMEELATQHGIKIYKGEAGFQPRMALCYSLTSLLMIFAELKGEAETMSENLNRVASRVNENGVNYEQEAYDLLDMVKKQIPNKVIVVADPWLEGVGLRFCQQIQENAKHEAFLHVLPEANHNVIESYYGNIPAVYFFLRSGNNQRIESRFDFLTSLLEVEYHKVINLVLDEYDLGSVLALIYRLDAFSLYLADLRQVNALDVPNIASLKEFLEGFN
jgi:glucose/mannose-6-phosphate isomerase